MMNTDQIEEDSDDYSAAENSGGLTDEEESESVGELGENFEVAKILTEKFHLPKDLCENPEIFNEFFSLDTFMNLSEDVQRSLMLNYLPDFPDTEDDFHEKQITLQHLFTDEIERFGSTPLGIFQHNLQEGNYRPDIAHYRKSIRKAEEREQRFQECERISRLARNLMINREKLLRSAYTSPPGSNIGAKPSQVVSTMPKLTASVASLRAKKRYFQEINEISDDIGLVGPLSDVDDNYPEGPPTPLSKKQKKQLNALQMGNASPGAEMRVVSTMNSSKSSSNLDHIFGSSLLSDERYRNLLQSHKKRKILEPDHPELETDEIRLKDILMRTQVVITPKKTYNVSQNPLNSKKLTNLIESSKIKREPSTSPSPYMSIPPSTSNSSSFQPQLNLSQSLVINTKKPQVAGPPSSTIPSLAAASCSVNVQERPIKSNQVVGNNETDEEDWIKANIIKVEPRQEPSESPGKKSVFPVPQQLVAKKRIKPVPTTTTDPNMYIISGGNQSNQYVKPVTLSDLDGIDMMSIPIAMENEAEDVKGPELMQETHTCFLSLLRDIFCSTQDHRMKLDDLRKRIALWLTNPISALNEWFGLTNDWMQLLTSAVYFLSGEFVEQPEDFVPYLEFKTQLNIYQWIGAGRDSDNHLLSLCNYWLSRRHEMGKKPNLVKSKSEAKVNRSIENSSLMQQRCISPPLPRCPTDWKVVIASDQEISDFREQERRRYENPHMAFTYRQHGYESVVGPVKGIYTQVPGLSKARDHNTLVADRPNFVTILALVRDATARLPNGEGTRTDICELLKSSQYISPQASDQVLQTIVSGALDRMHTEIDPCVKYDGKRKLWIYLHRNRSEEEFERLHLQQQGMTKHKKPLVRKTKSYKSSGESNDEVSPNNSLSLSPTQVIVAKRTTLPPKTLPVLAQIDNKPKISVMQMSPPPLKKVVSAKPSPQASTSTQSQQPEPFDVEASLDAHTTPILIKGQTQQMPAIKVVTSPGQIIQRNSPTVFTQSSGPATILENKKIVSGKPVIMSQAPPLVSQSSGNSYLIPINVARNDGQITTKIVQSLNATKLIKTSSEPPALTSTKQNIFKMAGKTLVRTLGSENSNQQQPKLILQTSAGQHSPKTNVITTVKSNSQQGNITPILSQQKQILQSILVQQQKQKSLQQNSQQQQQTKMPALTLASSSSSNPPVSTTQIIQIQGDKSQSQTQQSLLKTIQKQSQQTLIVKPQIIAQSKPSPGSDMSQAPPLVSMVNSNVSNTQTITKIIKPATATQILTNRATGGSNQNAPLVLTSGGAQLISLDSLLQKPGTTFKLAGTKPGPGLIQLQSAQPGQQISQYVVTSKGKNIIVGSPQRFITTQASNTKLMDSTSPSQNVSTQNNSIIIASPSQQSTQQSSQQSSQMSSPGQQQNSQSQPQSQIKIVQSGQIQSSIAQQLVNAKLINVQGLANKGIKTTGGIKMLNTQNYIANIGGKSLLITGKPTATVTSNNPSVSGTSSGNQGIVLQTTGGTPNGTSYILGSQGQTLKVQGNIITQGNVNIINQQNASQTQTMVLGNQLVKVQQMGQLQQSQQNQQQQGQTQKPQLVNASNNSSNNGNNNSDTVVLTTSGPLKVQPNPGASGLAGNRTNIILSSSLKNVIKTNPQGAQQRVVLATQSGQTGQMLTQQIILPANFQGGSLNLKNIKLIPISQQGVNSDQRVYARFLTTNPKPAVNNSNNNPSNTTSNSGNSSTQLVTEEINE